MMAEDALRALAHHGAVVRFITAPLEPAVRVTLPCSLAPDERVTAINSIGRADVVHVLLATAEEAFAEVQAVEARQTLRIV
jgi:hypothetical protein